MDHFEVNLDQKPEGLEDFDYYEYTHELSEAYNLLLADLSVRPSNEHVGSGWGGNYTQLHHLLSRNVSFRATRNTEQDLTITDDGSRLVFTFKCEFAAKKLDLRILRQTLDDYCAPLNLPEVSFEQITDSKWWEDQNLSHKSVSLLVSYLKRFGVFWDSFHPKVALVDTFGDILLEEEEEVTTKYKAEIGCPVNNEDDEDYQGTDYPSLSGLIKNHPVYGLQLKGIDKRRNKFINSLPSEKEKLFLQTSKALPAYVAILSLRKITIEVLVKTNLDNYITENKELMEYKNPTGEEK